MRGHPEKENDFAFVICNISAGRRGEVSVTAKADEAGDDPLSLPTIETCRKARIAWCHRLHNLRGYRRRSMNTG
jgi:hypothetical protein